MCDNGEVQHGKQEKAFRQHPAVLPHLQEPANILTDAQELQDGLGEVGHMRCSRQQSDPWVLQDLKRVWPDAVKAQSLLYTCCESISAS